jgi:hypothetical protein
MGAKVVSIEKDRITIEAHGESIDIGLQDTPLRFALQSAWRTIEERSKESWEQIKDGSAQAIRVFDEMLEIMSSYSNPFAAYQLVSKLVILFCEAGVERGIFSDTGILFEIMRDEKIQQLMEKSGFNSEELDKMPGYLQRKL